MALGKKREHPGFWTNLQRPRVPKVKSKRVLLTIEFEITAQQTVWDMRAKETTTNKSKDLINGKI